MEKAFKANYGGGGVKKSVITLFTSDRLRAGILAAMVLAFAACDNGSGGSDDNITTPPTVDPDKPISGYTINSISANFKGTSAKNLDEILNNTEFTVNYSINYTDNTASSENGNFTSAELKETFAENGVSFSVNQEAFSENNQYVVLTVNYENKTYQLSGITNENYKGQEGQRPSKTAKDLLKELVGEAEYDAIASKVAAGSVTLTADAIKAVGDLFPALEMDAKNNKEAKDVENVSIISQNKEAFVAQAEGETKIVFGPIYPDWYEKYPDFFDEETAEKKYFVTYRKDFAFDGVFSLDEIDFEKADGAQGNFNSATLTNNGKSITIDELNEIRGSSLPTLSFNKSENIAYKSSEAAVYNLYKAYSNKTTDLSKLDLNGELGYFRFIIDGKKLSGDENYTLFKNDGNEAKLSNDNTIKSLSVDALVQMTNQLTIYKISNMIISGKAKESAEVNWELRNIVFEGDMSNITNNFKHPYENLSLDLYGIVYFKRAPYNITKEYGQSLVGMLKLDELNGVYRENFKVSFSDSYRDVLDVRGADVYKYDRIIGSEIVVGGDVHAIYFNEDLIDPKGKQEEINKLSFKFSNPSEQGVFNAYLGNDRVEGYRYNSESYTAASKRPRTLKEFEYLGNYGYFEKSAKESYPSDEFDALPEKEQKSLNNDDLKRLAQNDKRIEFIDPETQNKFFGLVKSCT